MTSQPRRILVLTDDLGGGTGTHALTLWQHWDRRDWNVEALAQSVTGARTAASVPVMTLPPYRWFEPYPLGHLRRLLLVRRHVARQAPDLVHAYFIWSVLFARTLKRLGRIRYLVENREDQGFNWDRRDYALLRASAQLPDRVICVSEAVREVVLQREGLDPRRVVVIPNGIDAPQPDASNRDGSADRTAERSAFGFAADDIVVGMVANLNRNVKGVEYFIDAMPAILEAVPAARFLLVGDGPDADALRARADALGVGRHARFAGFRADIDRVYAAMDISVLTSLSEGLSITLLESMRAGLPVVVTAVGGNPEVVVDGETGYLVPARDVPAFVERVTRLARDRAALRAMGEAGRRRVRDRFGLQNVAARYLDVYREVLSGNGSSA